jgi:hypothetical protein
MLKLGSHRASTDTFANTKHPGMHLSICHQSCYTKYHFIGAQSPPFSTETSEKFYAFS